MRRGIVDNDVVLKLAQYGLLREFESWAAENKIALERLGTCEYVLCRPKVGASDEVREKIRQFCAHTAVLPEPTNAEILQVLSASSAINDGEALIFEACCTNNDALCFTGDKRALCALTQSEDLAEIQHLLSCKVYCIEQILAELMNAVGFEILVDAVRGKPEVDSALTSIFGRTVRADQSSVLEGLQSYYNAINVVTASGPLLAPFPSVN
jgi:hypothetical protein